MSNFEKHSETFDGWTRLGKGRNFQFFLTDQEISSILITALPVKFAPYSIVGIDIKKEGRKNYTRTPFRIPVNDLSLASRERRGNNMYWIWSEPLTPNLEFTTDKLGDIFTLNGLISLHHGRQREVRRLHNEKTLVYDVSSISITDKIYNRLTGETKIYSNYAQIFSNLKSAIRKILVYTSVAQSSNGKNQEVKFQLMSEGAAKMSIEGYPFINTLGNRIR